MSRAGRSRVIRSATCGFVIAGGHESWKWSLALRGAKREVEEKLEHFFERFFNIIFHFDQNRHFVLIRSKATPEELKLERLHYRARDRINQGNFIAAKRILQHCVDCSWICGASTQPIDSLMKLVSRYEQAAIIPGQEPQVEEAATALEIAEIARSCSAPPDDSRNSMSNSCPRAAPRKSLNQSRRSSRVSKNFQFLKHFLIIKIRK